MWYNPLAGQNRQGQQYASFTQHQAPVNPPPSYHEGPGGYHQQPHLQGMFYDALVKSPLKWLSQTIMQVNNVQEVAVSVIILVP